MKKEEKKRGGRVDDERTIGVLKARLGEENYIKQFSVRVAENLAKIEIIYRHQNFLRKFYQRGKRGVYQKW